MIENKKSKSCGQALVELLESYNVNTIFGIPGVHNLDLYRGIEGSGIRHVLTRHEQGAGFMADGYARISGKPGICFTITDPGVTNISTPVAEAYADSIPMLVLSSVNTLKSLGKGRGELHEMQDQRALMAPITAFSATAFTVDGIPGLIARAFNIFDGQRPRPVFIEFPLDILAATVDEDWAAEPKLLNRRPAANIAAIESATLSLAGAKQPVIIAGGGAIEAAGELQQLAEQLNAAVFTTVAGKGLLPVFHQLNAGATLCLAPTWDYIAKADVILAVGTELAETDMWREKLPLSGKLIRVDIDPVKMNDFYFSDVAMVSDAKQALQALVMATAEFDVVNNTVNDIACLQSTIKMELAPLERKHADVLAVLQQTLPSNGFIAADMTQLAYSGNYLFTSNACRSWLYPTGYGTLGYALPAAIGGAIASPDRPAVVPVGDGGLLYTVQELSTASEELRSPLVILLWNNQSLGQIRDGMIDAGINPIAVTPKTPDFIKLADSFGCHTVQPSSLDELSHALLEAFEYQGVSFIEVKEEEMVA